MQNHPPEPAVTRLSAVILAAGLSRRMGAANKLLLPFRGVPLLRCVAGMISALPFVEVIVATGHEAAAVEAALDGLRVRVVRNPDYEEGQMTTVRAGLAALGAASQGVMICLGDQPALTAADLELIAKAFLERAGIDVLVPIFRGARGNPIVLSRASLDAILARGGNFGCRQFVANNGDLVSTFEMPNDHVLVDVDRPEDYAALQDA